jgi:transcriptional regulator with XRE-family HTH domain
VSIAAECFATNLIRLRRQAGLSQEDLGWMASLHRTEISQLERGLRVPRIDTVVKLAASLEVGIEEMVEGIDWTPGSVRVGRFRAGEKAEDGDAPSRG